jgi:hypothetical protein
MKRRSIIRTILYGVGKMAADRKLVSCRPDLDLSPEQRVAFLEEASGGDKELRREVESLLRQSAHGMLDDPVWQPPGESALQPGAQLGPFQILAPLGAGGMGAV